MVGVADHVQHRLLLNGGRRAAQADNKVIALASKLQAKVPNAGDGGDTRADDGDHLADFRDAHR
jgi:hypothetical protein